MSYEAAREYLGITPTTLRYILPEELKAMMDAGERDFFILDIRKRDAYNRWHIEGAENIWFLNVLKTENLARLPKDKQIVVVCYVGHMASQILTILNLLGYNAVGLKYGMGVPPVMGQNKGGWIELDSQ